MDKPKRRFQCTPPPIASNQLQELSVEDKLEMSLDQIISYEKKQKKRKQKKKTKGKQKRWARASQQWRLGKNGPNLPWQRKYTEGIEDFIDRKCATTPPGSVFHRLWWNNAVNFQEQSFLYQGRHANKKSFMPSSYQPGFDSMCSPVSQITSRDQFQRLSKVLGGGSILAVREERLPHGDLITTITRREQPFPSENTQDEPMDLDTQHQDSRGSSSGALYWRPSATTIPMSVRFEIASRIPLVVEVTCDGDTE